MNYDPHRITYIGETDYRNKRVKFGIKAIDRTRHVYIIGKTGTGKSTLLENMAVQDIQNGEGFAFIDPHGKTADLLLDYIPEHRINDVLYFAPFDLANPISFNVMEDIGPDKRHLVAAGLMSAFKKIWVDAWSARMEYMLSNTILALLEYPGSTLLGISRMFADKEFRKEVVAHVTDPGVKSFWENEFANYTDKFAAEATPAIQNKIGQFTANPVIRNLIGQPKSTFNIREMMDNRKILIINLSKGQVGEDSANLLGSMLITKIYLAAMSRADMREPDLAKLPNFYLYVDEFQSFANESFADILSEARKYKLNLTIAHQYIEQMSDEVRAAVFGNVGTMITFRVGATDAEHLEKEFAPLFTAEDLVNLGFAQTYLKLMIDGMSSAPFSCHTLPPIAVPHISYRDIAIARSREQFARPREVVEEEIIAWHEKSFGSGGGNGSHEQRRDAGGSRTQNGSQFNGNNRNGPPRGDMRRDVRPGDMRDTRGNSRPPAQTPTRPPEPMAESIPISTPTPPPVSVPRAQHSEPARPPQQTSGTQNQNGPREYVPRQPNNKSGGSDEREERLRHSFSLNRLKTDSNKKKDKGPTEGRLDELRNALATVLQKTQEVSDKIDSSSVPAPQSAPVLPKTEIRNIPPKETPRAERPTTNNQQPTTRQPEAKIPEVPKEVLEKLFQKES